ncbi:autophagy-related protein 13 like protein [Ditylenchus destructor]|nr:autophagy-related protein 13 like protein [Ditylenchus destructor]
MSKQDSMRREQNEFAKFVRFFSTRMVQSVVQERMGHLVSHKCCTNPDTSDWFNLIVDEIGEVAAYMKSGIKKYPPNCPALTLDFFLYTVDGDSLPLESWVIRVDKNQIDENVNVHTTLYHQMSTLLKSVIMAAHFTPAYRYYVRKQSPETFVIFYRVFEGEPDLSLLGEGQKFRRLGYLPSPFGTLQTDLHYRTKMELLPPPFVEQTVVEDQATVDIPGGKEQGLNVLFNQASIPCGNIVPARGSETIAISPVTEDINSFSTSPLSNDLPFVENKSHFKLGRSTSSTDESATNTRHPSGSSRSDANSPKASNSFPQRTSSYKQVQIRNNSFPFASLLLSSQTSFDQTRSQMLPKVPEDAAVLHSSKSDRGLDTRVRPKRFSSLSSESTPILLRPQSTISENTSEVPCSSMPEAKESDDGSDKDNQSKKKVVFGCSSEENKNEEEDVQPQQNSQKGQDDDRLSIKSDDSYEYVNVIAFASSEDLGSDLSEFVKEVRLAPDNLHSFAPDNTDTINKQIDEFKEKAAGFDNFVAGLKDMTEES